jgi:hypothetical protein
MQPPSCHATPPSPLSLQQVTRSSHRPDQALGRSCSCAVSASIALQSDRFYRIDLSYYSYVSGEQINVCSSASQHLTTPPSLPAAADRKFALSCTTPAAAVLSPLPSSQVICQCSACGPPCHPSTVTCIDPLPAATRCGRSRLPASSIDCCCPRVCQYERDHVFKHISRYGYCRFSL